MHEGLAIGPLASDSRMQGSGLGAQGVGRASIRIRVSRTLAASSSRPIFLPDQILNFSGGFAEARAGPTGPGLRWNGAGLSILAQSAGWGRIRSSQGLIRGIESPGIKHLLLPGGSSLPAPVCYDCSRL